MLLRLGRGLAPLSPASNSVDSSPQTLAVFGDSISSQNTNISGNSTYYEAYGYVIALNFLTDQRYIFESTQNKGLSGDSTTNMDSRKVTDLGSLGADLIVVHGGTNDIASSVAASTIQNNLDSIYTYITGTLGAKVIAVPILPRTGLTAGQKTELLAVNDWIKAQASADILIADPYDAFDNGSDEPKTDYTYDGLHPSPIGSFVFAEALRAKLNPLYGVGTAFDPNDAGNLIGNGDFSGSSGTISTNFTGTAADGWKVYGYNSGTRTASKNGDGSQNISASIPSGNSSSESVYVQWESHVTSGYSASDTVFGEVDIEVLGGDRVQWLCLEVRDVGSSTLYYIGMDKRSSSDFLPLSAMGRGILRTPEFVVQGSNTKIEFRIRCEMNASSEAASLNYNLHGARLIVKS